MTVSNYAEYLAAQGESVAKLGGVYWMRYHGALIPANAMPVYPEIAEDDANALLRRSSSLFVRYTKRTTNTHAQWWYMVCRQYRVGDTSANTRSKIHRGLRRLTITKTTAAWLAHNGYECHVESYERYKNAKPQSRREFEKFILSLAGHSIFDLWICRKQLKLVGYVICLHENDGIFMHTIDLTPEGLHDYAAYAMLHHLLEYYVNGLLLPVTNGSRSISHETEMQDFLQKFNFQREYAELHVVYRPVVKVLVNMLYPLRKVLRMLDWVPQMRNICAVLFQEEITRTQYREI